MLRFLAALAQLANTLLREWRRQRYEKKMRKIEDDPINTWNEYYAPRLRDPKPKTKLPTDSPDTTDGHK